MNVTILIGRLTKDPETRYGQTSQKAVTRFSVACGRGKDREGKDLGTDYPNCLCFGKTAEMVERYCHKGMMVGVLGKVHTDSYENKEGKKVYTTEILADRVEFLEARETTLEKKQESKDLAAVQNTIDEMFSDDIPEGFSKLADDIPF